MGNRELKVFVLPPLKEENCMYIRKTLHLLLFRKRERLDGLRYFFFRHSSPFENRRSKYWIFASSTNFRERGRRSSSKKKSGNEEEVSLCPILLRRGLNHAIISE